MTAVDEIKARLDIVEIVSETVKLRRTGKNYIGFCPFHPNSRTPAFVVFPDSGTWRCFGQCNEGGDIFKFMMKKEGWDFPQTLQALAQRAGVTLEPQTPERQAEDEQYARLRGLLDDAVTLFRHHLLQTPEGQPALAYLQKRGLTAATIETFGLGYAPDSWQTAIDYFTAKGFSKQELLQVGLATERQNGEGVYDRFRNRITFPIRDAMGRMAGFGARILNPEDMPKFLNSPQTVLFDKGRLFYGLDQARKSIRAQDQVVIVEGYLDVIVLHQAGFTNTVSPMGTALTEDQLRLLKKYTRRIVLALDADAAGEKATLRGLELARQTLDRTTELDFDPRGLLHHEARLQADIRITTLPQGMDPDEVALRNPDEWKQILENAKPVVVHVMETLIGGRNDLDDAKVKRDIANQVLPLIEDVPNPVERDAYRQRLARLLKVDERSLLSARPDTSLTRPRRRPQIREKLSTAAQAAGLTGGAVKLTHDLEKHVLCLILRQPDSLYTLNRALQKAGLSHLDVEDFENTDHVLIMRTVEESLQQDDLDAMDYFRENLPESVHDLSEAMQQPMEYGEPVLEKRLEDLFFSVLRLRQNHIRQQLDQIRFIQEDLQEQGEPGLGPYQELFLQYRQMRDRLDRALGQPVQFD